MPAGFARHVEKALPNATSVVLDDCGHVPQYELPDKTHELTRGFLADDTGRGLGAEPVPSEKKTLISGAAADLEGRDPGFIRYQLPGMWLLTTAYFPRRSKVSPTSPKKVPC